MEGEIIASGGHTVDGIELAPNESTTGRDYNPKTTKPTIHFDEQRAALFINGAIALNANHEITAVKLELSFWPDSFDTLGVAKIIRLQDKTDIPENE